MSLRERFPSLRLIVVPRHQERFAEVAQMIKSFGLTVMKRTEPRSVPGPDSVMLLDTLGELSHCWGLADVAFVGGSFGDRGGQNMIEPAAFGAAVLVGPNTRNFADVVSALVRENGIVVVSSTDKFAGAVESLLSNAANRRSLGHAANRVVLSQRGASRKTVELLVGLTASQADNRSAGRTAA